MSIGSVIRAERLRIGLTQGDLADRLSITAGAVSHWESDRSTPRDEMFHRIAEIFGIDPNHLFTGGKTQRISVDIQENIESLDALISRIVEIVSKNNNVEPKRVAVEIRILPRQ